MLRAKESVAAAQPRETEAFRRPAPAPDDAEHPSAAGPEYSDVAGKSRSRARDYAAPVLLLLSFLVLWQAAVAVFALPHYILPSPIRVFQTLGQSWDILLLHAGRTGVEVLAGFAAAVAAGLGLAVATRARVCGTGVNTFVVRPVRRPALDLVETLESHEQGKEKSRSRTCPQSTNSR